MQARGTNFLTTFRSLMTNAMGVAQGAKDRSGDRDEILDGPLAGGP